MLDVLLSADYPGKPGVLREVGLQVRHGEVVGLVGQSGSGKSTLALAMLKLLHLRGGTARGRLVLSGEDIADLPESRMRQYRGCVVAYVPQSPTSSLSPMLRVRTYIAETWRAHKSSGPDLATMFDILRQVSLPASPEFLNLKAGQLSVGQGQRLLIGLAMLHRPKLIIADEPTSALDLITQQEVLRLFRHIADEHGTAMVYISHDLTSVLQLCDRVAILCDGQIIEAGATLDVFTAPQHPYARRLIGALPQMPQRTECSSNPGVSSVTS